MDAYEEHKGSLLPLWKFYTDKARRKQVRRARTQHSTALQCCCCSCCCWLCLQHGSPCCCACCKGTHTCGQHMHQSSICELVTVQAWPQLPTLRMPAVPCVTLGVLQVTALAWNPEFVDLFAAAFGSFDFQRQGAGLVACFSLKNPGNPEFLMSTPSGAAARWLPPGCRSQQSMPPVWLQRSTRLAMRGTSGAGQRHHRPCTSHADALQQRCWGELLPPPQAQCPWTGTPSTAACWRWAATMAACTCSTCA